MFVKEITSDRISIDAPAKLNLFLEVLNRRPDGFHNINSLFQAVSLYDSLVITLTDTPGAKISVYPEGKVSDGADNLIAQSYNLLRERYKLTSGIEVQLTKRIPVAAGLGGGSADGAATILALNRLCSLALSNSELAKLSLEIGSDLPFFFSRLQAMVTGRGEEIAPAFLPVDYHLLLVTPRIPISTADAYSRLKRGLTKPKHPFSLGRYQTSLDLLAGLSERGNDFEATEIANHPELSSIRGWLTQCGAKLVRMSGSGPTMFGWFDKEPNHRAVETTSGENWQINLVRPICLPK